MLIRNPTATHSLERQSPLAVGAPALLLLLLPRGPQRCVASPRLILALKVSCAQPHSDMQMKSVRLHELIQRSTHINYVAPGVGGQRNLDRLSGRMSSVLSLAMRTLFWCGHWLRRPRTACLKHANIVLSAWVCVHGPACCHAPYISTTSVC
jgi:hypothetical protein